jgi:hypothetical protein
MGFAKRVAEVLGGTVDVQGRVTAATTNTITERTTDSGVTIESVVLKDGTVDVNGTADALILDADADTTISAPTDDQIDFELNSVDHVVMKAVAAADAAATTNIVEIAFSAPVDTTGTNEHNALNIDIEIGNATGGTNTVNAIKIDNITGDAQVTETGLLCGTGFDIGIDMQGTKLELDADNDTSMIASTDDQIDVELGGVNHLVLKGVAAADAAATTNIAEIAFTSPVDTTGTNTHNGLVIDVEIGNASGGTNAVVGLQIDAITGDAQVTETAINIGSGWDSGITNASPLATGSDVTDRVSMKGIYMTPANVAVTVPAITDPDIAKVDVSVAAAFSMAPAVGDAVIAIPQEAMEANARILGCYVTATDQITVVFGSEGGNVTGGSKNFKFLVIDVT